MLKRINNISVFLAVVIDHKMEKTTEIAQRKNSNLSIVLIVVNILLSLILSTTFTKNNELDQQMILFPIAVSATVLLSAYLLTYRGKGYRWAIWLFVIALIISVAYIALLWYATGLAAAFKN